MREGARRRRRRKRKRRRKRRRRGAKGRKGSGEVRLSWVEGSGGEMRGEKVNIAALVSSSVLLFINFTPSIH